jgi:hypothetical protein
VEHVVQAKLCSCMVCSSGVSLLWFSECSDCIRSGGLAIRRSGGFLSECIDCGIDGGSAIVVQRLFLERVYRLWFSDSSLWWFLERVYRLWFLERVYLLFLFCHLSSREPASREPARLSMSDALARLCGHVFEPDPPWGNATVVLPESLSDPLPPVGAVRLMLDRLEAQQASVRQLIVYL